MKPNILLIGGAGFIGSNLAIRMAQYYNVFIINRNNENLKYLLKSKNITHVATDIDDLTNEFIHSKNFLSIVWLLHTSIPSSSNNLKSDFEYDLYPLINFYNRIKAFQYSNNFIYFSSGGTVYGNPQKFTPINEDSVCSPISQYGLIKLMAENVLRYLSKDSKFNTIILRPSNVYGNFHNLSKPQGVIGHCFNSILTNTPLFLYNDGTIVRDFIHVYDLTEFVLRIIQNTKKSPFEIFNVGSGEGTELNKLIYLIEEITQNKLNLVSKSPRDFDCIYNVLDLTRSMAILNWKPKIELISGVNDYWNTILKHKNVL
jgi:UDP-glucose 4-epimerase